MVDHRTTILIVEHNSDNRTPIEDVLYALDYVVPEAVYGVERVELAVSGSNMCDNERVATE